MKSSRFLLIFIFTFVLSLSSESKGQRASADTPPDFYLMLAPAVSGGVSMQHGSLSENNFAHTSLSWAIGSFVGFVDPYLVRKFFILPVAGIQYDSRTIQISELEQETHITTNSIAISAGLALPYVQVHFGMSIPLNGNITAPIDPNMDRIQKIAMKNINIVFEPRIILYYPFSIERGTAIMPYVSFGFPLNKSFDFHEVPEVTNLNYNKLRIGTFQIGITYTFIIYTHYPFPGII